MLKKLLVTAAAAAAVSVPLAGVAWADQPDGHDGGVGPGGVPNRVNNVLNSTPGAVDPNGPDEPNPPGSTVFSGLAKVPGESTPTTYGKALDAILGTNVFEPKTPPGLGVKAVTPACGSGVTGGDQKICGGRG